VKYKDLTLRLGNGDSMAKVPSREAFGADVFCCCGTYHPTPRIPCNPIKSLRCRRRDVRFSRPCFNQIMERVRRSRNDSCGLTLGSCSLTREPILSKAGVAGVLCLIRSRKPCAFLQDSLKDFQEDLRSKPRPCRRQGLQRGLQLSLRKGSAGQERLGRILV